MRERRRRKQRNIVTPPSVNYLASRLGDFYLYTYPHERYGKRISALMRQGGVL